MKKIIVTVIAVLAAAALSSCMGGTVGNQNTVDPAVKASESFAMNAEKSAGTYELESMDKLGETGKDAYTVNTITLNDDGTFEFNVTTEEESVSKKGSYSIAAGGVITFKDGFAIVAEGETVVCNGKNLTAEGRLGRMSTITMNYAKVTEEKKAEEEKSESETETENNEQ